jgi:hypothetical protein
MVFEVSHNWSWRTERLFVFTGHSPFCKRMRNTPAMRRRTKARSSRVQPRSSFMTSSCRRSMLPRSNGIPLKTCGSQISARITTSLPAEFALLSRSGSTGWTVNSEYHFGADFFLHAKAIIPETQSAGCVKLEHIQTFGFCPSSPPQRRLHPYDFLIPFRVISSSSDCIEPQTQKAARCSTPNHSPTKRFCFDSERSFIGK